LRREFVPVCDFGRGEGFGLPAVVVAGEDLHGVASNALGAGESFADTSGCAYVGAKWWGHGLDVRGEWMAVVGGRTREDALE
jgi:hypothetical protein